MEEEGEKGRRSRGGEVGEEEEGKEEEEDKMKKIAIHLFAIVLKLSEPQVTCHWSIIAALRKLNKDDI